MRPISSTVVSDGFTMPMIRPSYMTATRSDSLSTSSSSVETSSTPMPPSRCSMIFLWMYSIAPTSRPRVGCMAISSSGLRLISRATMTFCWLPPDRFCASS